MVRSPNSSPHTRAVLAALLSAHPGPSYGYDLSRATGLKSGTLYPILHGLERKGYLTSAEERVGARLRRVYQATPEGAVALATARQRVWELFGELFEPHRAAPGTTRGEPPREQIRPASPATVEDRGAPIPPPPRPSTRRKGRS